MAQQGAALQSYNNELVKSIEELQSRRAALNKQIEAEASEKQKLETEKKSLEDRLTTVDNSLKNKLNTKAEYDKVIAEAEQVLNDRGITKYFYKRYSFLSQAYVKILESSQLLLNVVKVRGQDLAAGKVKQREGKQDDKKLVNVTSSTENIFTTQLPNQ